MRKYLVTTTDSFGAEKESFIGTCRDSAVRWMKAEKSAPTSPAVSVALFREIMPMSGDWILLERHTSIAPSSDFLDSTIVGQAVLRQRIDTWLNTAPAHNIIIMDELSDATPLNQHPWLRIKRHPSEVAK